jgi:hypothetical protein
MRRRRGDAVAFLTDLEAASLAQAFEKVSSSMSKLGSTPRSLQRLFAEAPETTFHI